MERPAGRVAREAAEVQRLGDDSLAGESRVPVDEDGERPVGVVDALRRVVVGLRRSHLALDDRVDVLQVARVRGERDRDVAARVSRTPSAPRWYLTSPEPVSRSVGDRLEHALALELAQDRVRLAADGVREDVEAAAVRHADDDIAFAPLAAASSIASSSIGTITSRPSMENCFWPRKARRR